LNNKNKLPIYLRNLIKDYPKVLSGRKNFEQSHKRILKTLEIIKKYFYFKD
tara:strand:+ start:456 stop:608 length:153 start_codon:yes stop_codon:yes gene_type:complete